MLFSYVSYVIQMISGEEICFCSMGKDASLSANGNASAEQARLTDGQAATR